MIIELLRRQFSLPYNLDYLEPFSKVINDDNLEVIISTTNYDEVFDIFLPKHTETVNDGFSNSSASIHCWQGFQNDISGIKYLKLHGSFNWYKIPGNYFTNPPIQLSLNSIYKVTTDNWKEVLKEEIKDADTVKEIRELETPFLLLGGSKDRKILDSPFLEIIHEWHKTLLNVNTFVIVGFSGADFHLMRQIRSLLSSNKSLEKIIIIDIGLSSAQSFEIYLKNILSPGKKPSIFWIQSSWDLSEIAQTIKMDFVDMLKADVNDLIHHFSSLSKSARSG